MQRLILMTVPLLLAFPAPAQDISALDVGAESEIGNGTASYYGNELAGNRTASGERFDPDDMTGAHRSLPFGSRVRVTNMSNGQSVIVRINDRGPFDRRRVIDVSRAAAKDLGMIRSGTANVRMALIAEEGGEATDAD